ncbi:Ulp1-like peptidase [Cucumis melo var. makuwa]|uniref:Ulp1-like peptidase n=1 Tax=Cucumis melo var. makuwa TaxID=1194695 RepID=A0A5D3E031_CUCMM|nr:Ulp1-like peptidase [Cucumis melo var. makuwa]TYK29134.1 Ulp1-like peptidase [Cucumis melo var. makuwa]
MLIMVMTSFNVAPPSAKLQQQQNEKEVSYTKVVEKKRPPTCSLDLLDDVEQVNTMIDEENENNNWLIHLATPKTHVLTQILEEANVNGICFSILGKNVRFTQNEFNIITGLWPTRVTLEKDCDNKRLKTLLFGSDNKKIITFLELEEIFKNFEFTSDEDVVKIAVALFTEIVMVGKDKKTQFDMDILGKVDDEEVFKNFDRSTFFYTRMLNSLKTILQGKKEAYELKRAKSSKVVTYYNIKGYVLAFQVWAYEILSTASEHLATKNSKQSIPRILRWNCTKAPSYKMLQQNIFNNKNTVVQAKLKL